MRTITTHSSLALCLLLTACPGDDAGDEGPAGSSTTDGTTADDTSGPGTSGSTTDDPSTSGEDTTTSEGTSDSSDTTDTGVEASHWGALVRGTLFTDDLDMAQQVHDAVAMGGQDAAMAAGDYGHDALLGTMLLGTTLNEFLAVDQWDNLDGALQVYGDPKFQAAFGMLFGGPPMLELFERRDDWYGWGSLEAADGEDQHWFVVVRGRLVDPDLDAMQALHDGLAMGGEGDAMALGDVAHVVWVGTPEDSQEFFAIDVWTDDTNIEAFYGDPDFQAAFGMLFEAPPTVGVYGSTAWHQW
ncbi:MAG: hypothetical protein KDK70_04260 [Myxococcales bacterium]|nr:hypothetical protein [Myxococcales bacterium]